MTNYQVPHLAITVSDINKTKDFYKKIGFSIIEDIYSENKKRHFLLLNGYGLEVEVFYFEDQPQNQHIKTSIKTIGLQHIALPVLDINGKKKELVNQQIRLLNDINTSSLGVINLNIIDPSGITIEFFEVKNE